MVASDKFISQLQEYFLTKPVKNGYIFGSYARNSASYESDIDILVEVDYSQKVSLLDFIGWAQELEKITHKKIDLVASDGLSKYIRSHIEKEKVKIYERT